MIYPQIKSYLKKATSVEITEERKSILNEIVEYLKSAEAPKLNFICTHNSRRSHLSQIWAQTIAHHFGVIVETFSGGTEETAFHPNAVAALRRVGFKITSDDLTNPRYNVEFSDSENSLICYSKKYDEAPNPTSGFAAIMTCSEADAECPLVLGANKRIKLFYVDPKIGDNTPEQDQIYDERCMQIATEMFYVFDQIKG